MPFSANHALRHRQSGRRCSTFIQNLAEGPDRDREQVHGSRRIGQSSVAREWPSSGKTPGHLLQMIPIDIQDPGPLPPSRPAFHTGGRLIPFLNDLKISVGDLARGQTEAVVQLCDKAGEDPAPVLHNTISALGGRRYKLRHLEFAAEFTTGPAMRFCPICLRADKAMGGCALEHAASSELVPDACAHLCYP